MRKLPLFSAVLSLFLFAPASMTWAQITKTLNGTVRYESGMSKTTFTTPKGDVVVHLPQDMSGKMLTGTVSVEPTGKTEKEKKRNLNDLLRYVVNLGGQKIPLSETPQTFDWLVHQDRQLRTPMELLNASGAKLGEVSLPPVLSPPAIISGNAPRLSTPSTILIKGDALNVYTNQQFSPGEKFVVVDSKGQTLTLKPICLSSQQAVIGLPDNIAPGELTVREEVWNQAVTSYDLSNAKLNLVDLNISSPKTNLKPGERSEVILAIVTNDKGEWVSPDLEDILNTPLMRIDLRNLDPQTVTMQAGNLQRVSPSQQISPGVFQIRRDITASTVGDFSVSATLHVNYAISNDPFQPQMNVLQSAADFNNWAEALKKDLKQFTMGSSNITEDPMFDEMIKANAQRAIDNLPVCTDPNNLNECKAVASTLLRPLNIPKGAAISWLSSYEAYKAATKSLDNNLLKWEPAEFDATKAELIDYDVVKNGVEFINRTGAQLKDPSLQTQCSDVQQLIDNIQTGTETKENLQELRNKLNALMTKADMKIKTDEEIIIKTGMKDLVMSSLQLPSLAPPGRVHPYNDLIAIFDPFRKTLFYQQDYRTQVFEKMQPRLRSDGKYDVTVMSINRKPIQMAIDIVTAPPNVLFDVAKKDSTKKYDKYGFESTGELIMEKWDTTSSTWYRFYKNAKCKRWKEPSDGVCSPDFIIDSTGKVVETGKFHKTATTGESHCYKGTEFCTEMYIVAIIEYLYDDANCKRLIKVKTYGGWSCE